MRNPKDFFRPLAAGAPEPVREIPFRPSRMIHFFDPSNEKMAAKVPDIAAKVDIILGNLEDAIKAENKEKARQGLVDIAKATDFGDTQLWTRINSLDSPWVLDDLTTLVTEIGDQLDVIMVPKVEGAEDIHYVDRILAQPAARAGVQRPILVHAILRRPVAWPTSRRSARPAPHAGPLPRSGGPGGQPPHEDHPRGRRPPRLPGPPGPRRRRHRGRPHQLPAGPLALHHRPHGRCLRRQRHLRLLRALRRHQGRRGLRGPVPQRLPARVRRRLEPAPGPDRHREAGLLARPRRRRPRSTSSSRWATAPAPS